MHLAAAILEGAGLVCFTATRLDGGAAGRRLEAAVDGIALASLAPGQAGRVARHPVARGLLPRLRNDILRHGGQ